MTPEQEEKLDALIQDIRDMRLDNSSMSTTIDLMAAQMVSLGKEVGEHGHRLTSLESSPRRMSASVTTEIGEMVGSAVGSAVGDSIRVAAPEVARMVERGSIVRNAVTGAVLALAILAAILLGRH